MKAYHPFLTVLLITLLSGSTVRAATKTWVPTTGGAWAADNNWSPPGQPVDGDDVTINQSVTVTGVPSMSLSSLTVGGNCTLSAGAALNTLTITTYLTVASLKTLTLGGGTAGTRLNLTLASTTTASSIINGTVQGNSGASGATFTVNGILLMAPSGTISSALNFTLSSGATLQIGSPSGISSAGGSGNIRVTGTLSYSTNANYTYIGPGSQYIGSGLPTGLTGSLAISNSGYTVTLNYAGSIASGGTVGIVAGTFQTTSSLTMSSNSIINRSGGGMDIVPQGGPYNVNYSGNPTYPGAELSGLGLSNVTVGLTSGQTLTLRASSPTLHGDLIINSGTLDLSTNGINGSANGGRLTLGSGASLVVGGSTNFPARYSTVILDPSSTVTYTNAGSQTVSAQAYGNLTLSSSTAATKTISGGSIAGTLNFEGSASAVLNINVAAHSLSFAGVTQAATTWGSTASTAIAKDINHFGTSATGMVTVATGVGPAAKLAFTTQPGGGTRDTPWPRQPIVTVQDVGGNTVMEDSSAVTLAILDNPSGGTLSGTSLSRAAVNGVADFSANALRIDKTGNGYTLRATDGALTGATSGSFNIAGVGPPAKLAFTTQPGNGTGGSALSTQPAVTLQDASGNTIIGTSQNVTVTIYNNAGGGTLSGTATVAVDIGTGVATFNGLSIDKAGAGYTLTATGSTVSTTPGAVVSSPFNIMVGAAAKLAFTTQPGNGTGGSALPTQPAVALQDAGGNTVTGMAQDVTVGIQNNPGGGTLSGMATVAVDTTTGVAAFSGLRINKAGTGYTLTATGSTVSTTRGVVISDPFDINPGGLDHFAISAILSPQRVGTPIGGITITALDTEDNTANSFDGVVSFGGTAGITGTSANFTAGQLKEVSVTPTQAGSGRSLTVNAAGAVGASMFDVGQLPVILTGARPYDGTTTVVAGILRVANKVGNDDVAVVSGSGTLSSKDVGSPTITSVGNLALDGTAAENYTLVGASGSVAIGKAPLSITADNDTKVYGESRTYGPGSTAFTSSGLQLGETVGSVTIIANGGTELAANAGSYTLTPSDATGGTFGAGNYEITYNSGKLEVLAVLSGSSGAANLSNYLGGTIKMLFVATDSVRTVLRTNEAQLSTSDGSGGKSFTYCVAVPTNTAKITIKPHHYLRKVFSVPQTIATANLVKLDLTGTPFVGGDADNDNVVNGTDYAWLRYWWGKTLPGWTSAVGTDLRYDVNGDGKIDASDFPDLNGDGVIDALDYNILKGGWYQGGDEE